MGSLEDFIKRNRDAFDDKNAPEGAWKNIERSLGFRQRSLWDSVVIWRAAAIVFMVATILLLVPDKKAAVASRATIEAASNEFNDVEKFYIKQISDKVQLIDKFRQNEGLNGFTHDFQQLEAMYMVLKEEMKSSPSDKVKDALVLNLLIRIDLLNQQLHKLDKGYEKEEKREDRSV